MTCTELGAEVLMDHLLGDLDGAARARVVAHVAVCPECRESLETLGRLNEVIWATRAFQDIKVPADVHAQILDRCREALAAIRAMRAIAAPASPLTDRLAARRGAHRGLRLRRLAYLAAGAVGAAVFIVILSAIFSTGLTQVGVIETTSRNVEVIRSGEREGFAAGAGQAIVEGDRVRTTRLKASARVRLNGGGVLHIGGATTVRFLGDSRTEVLKGRAFAEMDGRSLTVSAKALAVTASTARFDLRILGSAEFASADLDASPPRTAHSALPTDEVLLTVAAGSVDYATGTTTGKLDAGWQLRLTGRTILRRQVETAPFWARWMTDAECNALPVATLKRLIKGPIERLSAGRVRLIYAFDTDEQMADWRTTVGAGQWARGQASLRGTASTGQRALIYHVARFQGDLDVTFDVAVDPSAPQSQSLWRIFADATAWAASGFSGWTAVERLEEDKPIRKVSLFYLDKTRASGTAAGLTALDYHVAVRCVGGMLTFQAGDADPIRCAVGDAPDTGHVGLGVAGGDVRFRTLVITGRLQPDWVRHALEQLAREALAGG